MTYKFTDAEYREALEIEAAKYRSRISVLEAELATYKEVQHGYERERNAWMKIAQSSQARVESAEAGITANEMIRGLLDKLKDHPLWVEDLRTQLEELVSLLEKNKDYNESKRMERVRLALDAFREWIIESYEETGTWACTRKSDIQALLEAADVGEK